MAPDGQRFDLALVAYLVICAAALFYLGIANARGYVPFASSTAKASQHTANHFHK